MFSEPDDEKSYKDDFSKITIMTFNINIVHIRPADFPFLI